AAISQLIDFVEQIDDIKPVLDALQISRCKIERMGKPDVQRRIGGHMFGMGKAAPQAAPRHHVGVESRVFYRAFVKTVRSSPRSSKGLIMIEVDPVVADKIQLVLTKEKLRRGYFFPLGPANR